MTDNAGSLRDDRDGRVWGSGGVVRLDQLRDSLQSDGRGHLDTLGVCVLFYPLQISVYLFLRKEGELLFDPIFECSCTRCSCSGSWTSRPWWWGVVNILRACHTGRRLIGPRRRSASSRRRFRSSHGCRYGTLSGSLISGSTSAADSRSCWLRWLYYCTDRR